MQNIVAVFVMCDYLVISLAAAFRTTCRTFREDLQRQGFCFAEVQPGRGKSIDKFSDFPQQEKKRVSKHSNVKMTPAFLRLDLTAVDSEPRLSLTLCGVFGESKANSTACGYDWLLNWEEKGRKLD